MPPATLLRTTFLALDKYNFPNFFCQTLPSIYLTYFANFHSSSSKISGLASLGISFLISSKLKVKVLPIGLGFTYFRGVRCTPKPQLLSVGAFTSCNMKTNAVMILPILKCKFPI